ncbi:MAG: hypothetical protein K8823_568 [Cenarchaeum symbiont of Oopsacas minuta]|nr:hypothetical protein [Cenarchaeum symbiont of Oopsacas minuta]
MKLKDILAQLNENVTASARIGDCEFDLYSIHIWCGKNKKWRLSGTVKSKSVLDLVGKSMLGPNKDPADVVITITVKEIKEILHANLTSSMETNSKTEITFTLLEC